MAGCEAPSNAFAYHGLQTIGERRKRPLITIIQLKFLENWTLVDFIRFLDKKLIKEIHFSPNNFSFED